MSKAEVTMFDVPGDAEYGDYPITEIGFNHDTESVFVIYEGDDLVHGWDQLIFGAEQRDGEIQITHVTPGLVPPERLPEDGDTPGGKESKALYELLEELGIRVMRFDGE